MPLAFLARDGHRLCANLCADLEASKQGRYFADYAVNIDEASWVSLFGQFQAQSTGKLRRCYAPDNHIEGATEL